MTLTICHPEFHGHPSTFQRLPGNDDDADEITWATKDALHLDIAGGNSRVPPCNCGYMIAAVRQSCSIAHQRREMCSP